MRVVVAGHVRGSPSQSHPPHCAAHPGSTLRRGARRSLVGHATLVLGWLAARWSRVGAGCRGPPGCHERLGAVLGLASRVSPAAYWAFWRGGQTRSPSHRRAGASRKRGSPSSALQCAGQVRPACRRRRRPEHSCKQKVGLLFHLRTPPAQRPGCRPWAQRLSSGRGSRTRL